jgi:hypothetical protein
VKLKYSCCTAMSIKIILIGNKSIFHLASYMMKKDAFTRRCREEVVHNRNKEKVFQHILCNNSRICCNISIKMYLNDGIVLNGLIASVIVAESFKED